MYIACFVLPAILLKTLRNLFPLFLKGHEYFLLVFNLMATSPQRTWRNHWFIGGLGGVMLTAWHHRTRLQLEPTMCVIWAVTEPSYVYENATTD
jgi:hypothetical protein